MDTVTLCSIKPLYLSCLCSLLLLMDSTSHCLGDSLYCTGKQMQTQLLWLTLHTSGNLQQRFKAPALIAVLIFLPKQELLSSINNVSVELPEGSFPVFLCRHVPCSRDYCVMQILLISFQILKTSFSLTLFDGCLLLRSVKIVCRDHLPSCQAGVLGFSTWLGHLPTFPLTAKFLLLPFPVHF